MRFTPIAAAFLAAALFFGAGAFAGAPEIASCTALPPGGVLAETRDDIPKTLLAELEARFAAWNRYQVSHGKPAEPSSWMIANAPANPPSGPRRFVYGGHYQNRWFVWYEHRGDGDSIYHAAVADVSKDGAQLVFHMFSASEADLCQPTRQLMADPQAAGPGVAGTMFW